MQAIAGQDAVLRLSLGGNGQRAAGREVRVVVTLQNVGTGDLWVNGRMLVNADHALPGLRELGFDVRGPDGRQRPFSCKVRAGLPAASKYRMLKPGETTSVEYDLAHCFDLKLAGAYRIEAHYEDANPSPPPAPNGSRHLSAPLVSQPMQVDIVA